LGYIPARGGKRLAFHLSYRQRGASVEDSSIFNVGANWSCSFRAYVIDIPGTPDVVLLHRGGAGYIQYYPGTTQYRDGSILTSLTSGGYQIQYPNGAIDTFAYGYTADRAYWFLSSRADPQGNTINYSYSVEAGPQLLLTNVTDPDGLVTSLYYENSTFPLITKVVDPPAFARGLPPNCWHPQKYRIRPRRHEARAGGGKEIC
jgi:hypothetical protein